MSSVMIRVPAETHRRLQELAVDRGERIGQVVAAAVKRLEDDAFWEEAYRVDAAMRADPVASAAFDAEVAAWDGTLMDGLEPESWDR